MQRCTGCRSREGGQGHRAPPANTIYKALGCAALRASKLKVFYTLSNLLEAKFVAQN